MNGSDDDEVGLVSAAPTDALLSALVALLADAREADEERTRRRKTEVLLADAGLKPPQIAGLLGKKTGAVRMSIARARKAASPGAEKD